MFKNLTFHRLPADWTMTGVELESQLEGHPLRPCGPFDMSTQGWVSVMEGGRLLHTVNGHHLIALGMDEKLLPGSIVRQVAAERALLIEQEQGFPVGRKQMRDLRLKVTDELRARALTRRRVIRAWLDPAGGWFAIDSASAPRAEAVVEMLGVTLGSFVPRRIESDRSPQVAMASWLHRTEAPAQFSLDDELELQSADALKSVIRYTRHPLDSKEIRAHLSAGKLPTRLGLTWRDRVSLVLTDKLLVKRLQFLELGTDTEQGGDVDPAEQFDIDFAVTTGELTALLTDLTRVLDWPARSKVA